MPALDSFSIPVNDGLKTYNVLVEILDVIGDYKTSVRETSLKGRLSVFGSSTQRVASCEFDWNQTLFPEPRIAHIQSPNKPYQGQLQKAIAFTRATIEQIGKDSLRNNRSPGIPPATSDFYETKNIIDPMVRYPCLAKAGKSVDGNPSHKNLCLRRAAIINKVKCESENPELFEVLKARRAIRDKSVYATFQAKYGNPLNFGEWKAQFHGEYDDYLNHYRGLWGTHIDEQEED